MNPFGRIIYPIIILILIITSQIASAQSTTFNSLTITALKAVASDEGSGNEYRWIPTFQGQAVTGTCFKRSGSPGSYAESFQITIDPINNSTSLFVDNITNAQFALGLEAWEDDTNDIAGCGNSCTFDKCGTFGNDDDIHCGPSTLTLDLNNFEPGLSNTFVFNYCVTGNPYGIQYTFSYNVPTPSPINSILTSSTTDLSQSICDANPILNFSDLNSYLAPFNRFTRAQYIWEYSIGSALGPWNVFATTAPTAFGGGGHSFSGIRSLVGNISSSVQVFFRVKTHYTTFNGSATGFPFDSNYISAGSVEVNPLAPSINSFSSTLSCSNSGTAIITANVTGIGQGEYIYIIRDGADNSAPCNPDLDNCGTPATRVTNIDTNGNEFTVPDVSAGVHTLIVFNKGGTTGVCSSYVNVNVGEIPALQLPSPSITSVSCHGGSDGAVTLSSSNGLAPFSYSLNKAGFSATNNTGLFSALPAGTYTASVSDNCGSQVQASVNINEPLNILATVDVLSLTCQSPANGSVQVNITQGEGTYSFGLFKNSLPVSTLDNAVVNSWTVDNLSSGDYTIEIKDAARLQCDGVTYSVTLAEPVLLQIDPTTLTKQNVTCFGNNDGLIELAILPSAQYNYILTDKINGNAISSTTPSFSGLSASSYTLTKQRNLTGCNDSYDYPLPLDVIQPEEIIVALNTKDVSCFGNGDGQIEASVQGSVGPDQYTWETNINGNWSTLSNSTATLSSLSGGAYRFTIVGSNGCSEQVQTDVIEPELLAFSNVAVTDITCFGDNGKIETTVTGGVMPYSYTYGASGNVFQTSASTISVTEGHYSLRVADNNGCQMDYGDIIIISSPSAPLGFTYSLSDYNGYNISCTGANNAYAQLVPTGGNGGPYLDYSFALDGNFQSNSLLENISPGVHELSVQDGRGCIVVNTISITEPSNSIVPTLLAKRDVKCDGDNNGQISVSASGGLNNYSFTLSNNVQEGQDSNFDNLAPGSYTIYIKDKNGCTAEYSDEILLLTPSMHIVSQVTNVTCEGGSDGSIQIEANGGDAPLSFSWDNGLGTSLVLQNIPAGDYILTLRDQQNCVAHFTNTVTEPALPLTISSIPIPVCVGKTTGEIRVNAKGGTAPYEYSVDIGNNYASKNVISALAAGSHSITVRDAHGCLATSQAEITVRNDLPKPDFIIASAENALDTLVVNEISIPKPDSVNWTFDTGITVINDDPWAPFIRVNTPGEYTITMTGSFGGCEYSKSDLLNISPYDPDSRKSIDITSDAFKQVVISPNPNKGNFNIRADLNVKQLVSVQVIDVLGSIHFSKKWDRTLLVDENVILANAIPGIYFVRVICETDAYVTAIVVDPQ